MATETQVQVLEEILRRGPWNTQKKLMSECLKTFPPHFDILSTSDANIVIDYGNEVLGKLKAVSYLRSVDLAPYLPPDTGRCVDMWQEDEEQLELYEGIEVLRTTEDQAVYHDLEVSFDAPAYHDEPAVGFEEVAVGYPKPHTEFKVNYETVTTGTFRNGGTINEVKVEYDDTGQPMYKSYFVAEPAEPTESGEARKQAAIENAKTELEIRCNILKKTIPDKDALRERIKSTKRALGYELSKKLASERAAEQKLKTLSKMYGVSTGRISAKKRN